MIYDLISKVLINVLLMFILIAVFFFTYGVNIEKQVIVNQMKLLSFDFMKTFELTGKKNNTELYNFTNDVLLSQKNIDKIKENDADALKGNQKIIDNVMLYIGVFLIAVVLIVLGIAYFTRNIKREGGGDDGGESKSEGKIGLDIGEILVESSIIIVFIGLTYYVFLQFFGSKYISINTNNVKNEIIQSLQSFNEYVKTNKPRENSAAH